LFFFFFFLKNNIFYIFAFFVLGKSKRRKTEDDEREIKRKMRRKDKNLVDNIIHSSIRESKRLIYSDLEGKSERVSGGGTSCIVESGLEGTCGDISVNGKESCNGCGGGGTIDSSSNQSWFSDW